MTPTQEELDFWLGIMRNIKGLSALNMQNLKVLQEGLVVAAFLTPILRKVIVNETECIAHVAFHIEDEVFTNPLEHESTIGTLRARIPPRGVYATQAEIQIEQYVGEKHVSDENWALLKEGNLLPWHKIAIAQDFAESSWKHVRIDHIRKFKKMEIVEHIDKPWHNISTFSLLLFS